MGHHSRSSPIDVPSTPGVSVVIPVRDDAASLHRCLRAVQAQTLKADEVIVVDDRSRDAAGDVAKAWGARVVRVEAGSIPVAAAAGYDAARFSIIARLDADSQPPPEWLSVIVESFRRHPDAGAVTGSGVFSQGRLRGVSSALYLGAYRFFAGAALGHTPLFGSNLAIRRDEWLRVRRGFHTVLVHWPEDLPWKRWRRRHARFRCSRQ